MICNNISFDHFIIIFYVRQLFKMLFKMLNYKCYLNFVALYEFGAIAITLFFIAFFNFGAFFIFHF